MKEYIPNPVDTGHIQLPKELEYLVEEMAKNVHEVWSKTRIEQGWTYGKKRDDVLKQHPCLVPYEELPEEEKVYDRNSSVETLKLIMKLGIGDLPASNKINGAQYLLSAYPFSRRYCCAFIRACRSDNPEMMFS